MSQWLAGQVVRHRRPAAGNVTVTTSYPLGSGVTAPETSHLLEHLLFAEYLRGARWKHGARTSLDTVSFTSSAPACFGAELLAAHGALREGVAAGQWGAHHYDRELQAIEHERHHRSGLGVEDHLLRAGGALVHGADPSPYRPHFGTAEAAATPTLTEVESAAEALATTALPVTAISGDTQAVALDEPSPTGWTPRMHCDGSNEMRLGGLLDPALLGAGKHIVSFAMPARGMRLWTAALVLRYLLVKAQGGASTDVADFGFTSVALTLVPLYRSASLGLLRLQEHPDADAPDLTERATKLLHHIATETSDAALTAAKEQLRFGWSMSRSQDDHVALQVTEAALCGDPAVAHRGGQRLSAVTRQDVMDLVAGVAA